MHKRINQQHQTSLAAASTAPLANYTNINSDKLVTSAQIDTAKFEKDAAAASADHPSVMMALRGGESNVGEPTSLANTLASFWGSFGVVYILAKAIVRVFPIALEPFAKTETTIPLTPFQMVAYITTCAFFAYAEGYKGFQKKFAPLVVARSRTLQPGRLTRIHHTLLAPLYSMGLFHATKKRMIVSWSVSVGVGLIVHAVKKLPYPWRNIVDAGVIVGLSWGAASIGLGFVKGIWTGGKSVDTDPALPAGK